MSPNKPTLFPRPAEGDCPPYYFRYTDLVPDDVDISTLLHTQRDWFGEWIDALTPEKCQFRYAEGKWSLAELIGHVLDCERIFAYRMLAISRNDQNSLPGFDQDDYVRESNYHHAARIIISFSRMECFFVTTVLTVSIYTDTIRMLMIPR